MPFTSDAPVFITAPQEIALYRGKRIDIGETAQMRTRVKYFQFSHTIPEAERKEVKSCGACGARLYLEGKSVLPEPISGDPPPTASSSSHEASHSAVVVPPAAKKAKTAAETVQELKDLKELKDQGLVDSPEFKNLKGRILRGD